MKSYNLKSPLINSNTTLNSKILFEGVTEKSDLTISGEIYEDLTKKTKVTDMNIYFQILISREILKQI